MKFKWCCWWSWSLENEDSFGTKMRMTTNSNNENGTASSTSLHHAGKNYHDVTRSGQAFPVDEARHKVLHNQRGTIFTT